MLSRAYARGVGVKTPIELEILKNFITCAKELNCFHILFAMPLNETPHKNFLRTALHAVNTSKMDERE